MNVREKEQSLRRAGFSRKEATIRASEWKRLGLLNPAPDKAKLREVAEPADEPVLLREVAEHGFPAGVRGLLKTFSFGMKANVRARSANPFVTKQGVPHE